MLKWVQFAMYCTGYGVLCCLQVCVVMSSGNEIFGIGNLNYVTYHLEEIDPLSVSVVYKNNAG